MPERVHELKRRAPDPIPEATAPIDVKLRSVALVVIATASAVALLYLEARSVHPDRIEDLTPIGELPGE